LAATRILIVEDHLFFSEALRMLLERRLSEGHGEDAEFRLAATVGDGLRIAREEGPFDVAVVDLMLPDGDGTEVVRRIKAAHPRTRVAVLSSARDLSGALAAGADEALGKAVPLPVIIEALGRLASGGESPPA
jgi:two-component system, NarL family, nitrate/nitrite response regulator NarL